MERSKVLHRLIHLFYEPFEVIGRLLLKLSVEFLKLLNCLLLDLRRSTKLVVTDIGRRFTQIPCGARLQQLVSGLLQSLSSVRISRS